MIPYDNHLTGKRDYHPPISKHVFNPPRKAQHWPWILVSLGGLLLLTLLLIGALR